MNTHKLKCSSLNISGIVAAVIIVLCFLALAGAAHAQSGSPNVLGYMSVRRIGSTGPLIRGDTVRWTIDYINTGTVDVINFQIRDIIREHLTLRPGSNQISLILSGSTASRNPSYDGIGNDATSDLLAPGSFLPVNGRIQVVVDTLINIDAPESTSIGNQSAATGSNVSLPVLSDNIDWTNIDIAGPGSTPLPNSLLQPQSTSSVDPTVLRLLFNGNLELQFEGSVVSSAGRGIKDVRVTVRDLLTSESKTTITNSFGYYKFVIPCGFSYQLSVQNRRYHFESPTRLVNFCLGPVLTDFVGTPH